MAEDAGGFACPVRGAAAGPEAEMKHKSSVVDSSKAKPVEHFMFSMCVPPAFAPDGRADLAALIFFSMFFTWSSSSLQNRTRADKSEPHACVAKYAYRFWITGFMW